MAGRTRDQAEPLQPLVAEVAVPVDVPAQLVPLAEVPLVPPVRLREEPQPVDADWGLPLVRGGLVARPGESVVQRLAGSARQAVEQH